MHVIIIIIFINFFFFFCGGGAIKYCKTILLMHIVKYFNFFYARKTNLM